MTHGTARISARQAKAIRAICEGRSLALAASAANVNPATLFRWRQEPVFLAALQSARDAAFSESLETIRRSASTAAATVESLMQSKNDPTLRLAAAKAILSSALRTHELLGLEQRIAALEESIGGARGAC